MIGVLILGNSGLVAEHSTSEMTNSDRVESYDRKAKTELSPNDIKAFVYQWFAYFDHQADLERITRHLGDLVDMAFPDFPIRSKDRPSNPRSISVYGTD
jgi:hypothetical protein